MILVAEATEKYNAGVEAFDAGNIPDAEKQFRQAIALDSNYIEAYYNLGHLLLQTERLQEAVQAFEKAISINPNIAMLHFMLGTAWAVAGDELQSFRATIRGLQVDPYDPNGHSNAGRAAFFLESYWDASLRYFIVTQISEGDFSALLNLGASVGRLLEYDLDLHIPGEPIEVNNDDDNVKLSIAFWALNLESQVLAHIQTLKQHNPEYAESVERNLRKTDIRDRLHNYYKQAIKDPDFTGIELK